MFLDSKMLWMVAAIQMIVADISLQHYRTAIAYSCNITKHSSVKVHRLVTIAAALWVLLSAILTYTKVLNTTIILTWC